MIQWKNLTAIAMGLAVLCTTTNAQTSSQNNNKEKSQEIVIRKSGDKSEKMTIVVEGDKVTVNGKDIKDIKDGDITVIKRERSTAPRSRTIVGPRNGMNSLEEVEVMGHPSPARAILGVVTETGDGGAKITQVTKESGAEKAGLKKDDVITRVGDKKIESSNDLIAAIGSYKPNDKIDVTYKRDGSENKTTATLGESKSRSFSYNFNNDDFNFSLPEGGFGPFVEGFGFSRKPKIGLQIQDLEEGSGVKVQEVDDDSPAEKAGVKEGDVITQINGKSIAGVDELRNEIKQIKEGDVVKMTYKRGNKTQTAEVKIPKRVKTANL